VHRAFLPRIVLSSSEATELWLRQNGSTYVRESAENCPVWTRLARRTLVPWIVQPGYDVEVFAAGLQLPVKIAFANGADDAGSSDPYMYVTELYGAIKTITPTGAVSTYASGLLNYDPTGVFPGSGEQGVAGVCVQPATGDLYVTLVYEADGHLHPKVSRFHSTDDGLTGSITDEFIMSGTDQDYSHQISAVYFGPDNLLYVHMGDAQQDSAALDTDNLLGKILRMTADFEAAGSAPFYDDGDGISNIDYLYAIGLRNPFGGVFRDDASHWVVDVGNAIDRFVRIPREISGDISETSMSFCWDGQDGSMLGCETSICSGYPCYKQAYIWNDDGHAPTAVTFIQGRFRGSGFQCGDWDHAFVAESGPTWSTGQQNAGKRIVKFALNQYGIETVGGSPSHFVDYDGDGKATVVALEAGPDGLYFSDFYKDMDYGSPSDAGANIWRVFSIESPCECPGADYNGDGNRDQDDVIALTQDISSGMQSFPPRGRDFNRDGNEDQTDIYDLISVISAGPCPF
jgi:hypothetical protein